MSNPDYRLKRNLPGLKAGVPFIFNEDSKLYENTAGRTYVFTVNEVKTMNTWFEKLPIIRHIPETITELKKGLTFGQIIAYLEQVLEMLQDLQSTSKCKNCEVDYKLFLDCIKATVPD